MTYIEDYVDQCLKALSDQNWELICELMDVDSFVDFYIIQEMYMNKDCFWRSVYFYKEPGGKLYAGPVWDMDQGAGNVSDMFGGGVDETTPDIDFKKYDYTNSKGEVEWTKNEGVPWIAGVNTWYRRLLRNEEFVALVQTRLKEYGPVMMEILDAATTDNSNSDSYYSLYGEAMERNFERWQILGRRLWPNSKKVASMTTVTEQIDYTREWLIERYNVLCKHYNVEL